MFKLLMVLIIITVCGCEQGSHEYRAGMEYGSFEECVADLDLSHVTNPVMVLRLEMMREIECEEKFDSDFEAVKDLGAVVACFEDADDHYVATMDYCECLYYAGAFDKFPCTPDGINKTYRP